MTAKHAQGELVDPGLQQGSKLPLEEGGLVLRLVLVTSFALHVGVQQAIGICCVVVIVSLDQGEERLGDIGPLLCLRGGGTRGARPLGATSPSGEAEAAPAAVPGRLRFVGRALADASLVICTPGEAGHFHTLHFKLGKAQRALLSLRFGL